jgi:hypothetical protein
MSNSSYRQGCYAADRSWAAYAASMIPSLSLRDPAVDELVARMQARMYMRNFRDE